MVMTQFPLKKSRLGKGSWVLYILECRDQTLYTGISRDLKRRLEQHRKGRASRYTRGRGPVKLIYQEYCDERSAALKREAAIKSLSRAGKMRLVREKRI